MRRLSGRPLFHWEIKCCGSGKSRSDDSAKVDQKDTHELALDMFFKICYFSDSFMSLRPEQESGEKADHICCCGQEVQQLHVLLFFARSTSFVEC